MHKVKHVSKTSILNELDSLKTHFERMGYFNHKLDTLKIQDTLFTAYFDLGKSYESIRIFYNKKIIPKKILYQITSKVTDSYFEIEIMQVPTVLHFLANHFEKEGNSFTTVQLDEITFQKNSLHSKLIINTSTTRTIDKLIIEGFENFPKTFVKHYFNIKHKTIFSNQRLQQLSNQVNTLAFVAENKSPAVLFTPDSTFVYLYLKKRKANKFDGLIGFTSDAIENKLQFNGYLDLSLTNIFNAGERISIYWKNNGDNKQFFDLNVEVPFIFNTALTPELGLYIYKQDSTFITTKTNIALSHNIDYQNKLSLGFISETSSNLLDISTANIINYNSSFYGASYHYRVLNNSSLFPIKLNFKLEAYLGSRNTTDSKTRQTRVNVAANYLWGLNFRNSIFLQNNSSILISDNVLTNELYRVGGVNSIRGFNEESIFASQLSILNVEYRYTTNNRSYLYSISDAGYIKNQFSDQSQQIFSLGLGYAFTTNFGLLNLSYAVGKLNNLSFDFSNSKFHIKITSFF